MNKRRERLQGKVVVITGASSGLGRAAAVEFARRGCRVAVAARRVRDLEQTAQMCREAGGSALAIVTDVTREQEMQRLAEAALSAWGQIDIWVNNAGVTMFARLAEAPVAEHQRVIETNVFGALHGARAAVPLFKQQGHGVLINVGSVLSLVGQPFVPSYVISKFALRGLSEALRAELADEPDVHVCTLLPYVIDTAHFQSGASAIGWRARAMPPAQAPEKVARAMVALAARPRRELYVPRVAVLGLAWHWLMPRTTDRLLLRALRRWHFDDVPQPATTGNLYAPVETHQAAVHGQRRPQLGAPGLAAWTARELIQIEVEAVRRRVDSWLMRAFDGHQTMEREVSDAHVQTAQV